MSEANKTADNEYTPIIAIDFDGTIVQHDFPRIGELMPDAKRVINKWADMGWHILVWTCRNNYEPDHPDWDQAPIGAVAKFCDEQGLKITGINQQQANLGFYLEARKIFANVYIDDRNLGGFPGWNATEAMVEKYFAQGGKHWNFYTGDMFNRHLHGGALEQALRPIPQTENL